MDNAKLKVLCGELEGLVSRIKSTIDEGGKEVTKDDYLAMDKEKRNEYDKNQVMNKNKKEEVDMEEEEK